MQNLICPNCNKPFTVNDADYAALLNQVKNKEFSKELDRRVEELHHQWEAEQATAAQKAENDYNRSLSQQQIDLAKKDSEIEKLKAQLQSIKEVKASELKQKLAELQQSLSNQLNEKDRTIAELTHRKSEELAELRNQQQLQKKEAELSESNLKTQYEERLKIAQEQIDYYKDLKTRLSTRWSANRWRYTAPRSSTNSCGPSCPTPILRRTTTLRVAARATSFSVTTPTSRTGRTNRSTCPLCSK